MSGILGYHNREAVRVKVKKCDGLLAPEYRKFSVDPQITSFEVLQSLLARAFDIKGEFTISYLAYDDEGQETYLSLLSDWDLDAAFLSSSDPCLQLKVDLKPFEEGLEDWDIITPVDFPKPKVLRSSNDKQSFTGTLLNHVSMHSRKFPEKYPKLMERTLNLVQRALNIGDNENSLENLKPIKAPMSDREFHNYLDSNGRLVKPKELRLSVYQGGIEPSLRKVVWKHILNVYPDGLSGKERMAYMRKKSSEYDKLCKVWKSLMDARTMTDEMQFVTNMVRKDVLRTDRTHKFYAGADDNKNVVSLFNILTTYALNHPSVSYCQGMSDLASPILVIMKDEAQAYVCFCALMKRLKPNFQLDGLAMTTKFQHLSELLQHYDIHFFDYLKQQTADDLLFCYRWLLLELKREFAFDDALIMLEVLWSSLPPTPPPEDLALFETEYTGLRVAGGPQSPLVNSRENAYTKVRAIRKQNSTSSIKGLMKISVDMLTKNAEYETCDTFEVGDSSVDMISTCKQKNTSTLLYERLNSINDGESSADDSQEYPPMTTSIMRELRIDLENLNKHIPGSKNYFFQDPLPDDKDLESPHCTIFSSCENNTSPCSYTLKNQSLGNYDMHEIKNWTSNNHSEGAQIRNVESLYYRRGCPECLQINNECFHLTPNNESTQCCTPDEQCEIELDEHLESSSSTLATKDSICNGDILGNEASYNNSNDSTVEERHRHISNESDISATSSMQGQGIHDPHQTGYNNHSEGYVSDANLSSKETSIQLQHSCHMAKQRLLDSGVIEATRLTNSCEEALEYTCKNRKFAIPSPQELGGGNPFMLFLCLTLLLQHRDTIVRSQMDYNELAMHFDKMVRKHHVHRVLHQSRTMFAEYLRMDWQEESLELSNSNLPI